MVEERSPPTIGVPVRLPRLALVLASFLAIVLVPAEPAAARPVQHVGGPPAGPVKLIVDTDFGQWWDDVAALALVHAAASTGRVDILGVMSDVDNPWNAAGLDALNTWYGRPDIPIGVPSGAAVVDQSYSRLLAERYPHAGRPVDAVALYRRLLRSQPDHSVTILSIGALTNLAQLARTDAALIARKVARTVIMGGQYPAASTPEWNFGLDLPATRQVVATWATPTVYDGYEIGARVLVGNHVCATHPASSPVRAVFDLLYGCGTSQTDGTWDPTAAYFAVAGTAGVYTLAGAGGHNTVAADGTNAWVPGERGQRYLVMTDAARLTNAIDTLIDQVPRT
jgi:pyrimidine-specific ribonucleoside hydrolase